MAKSPFNGYAVWPSGRNPMKLRQAKAMAKAESKEHGYAFVENADNGKTVAKYENGRQTNPSRKKRKLSGAAKASHLMKRGRKKLRAFVRSQSNRGRRKKNAARRKKNPVRVGAQVVGSGTGWIKAKAVKVRKVKGKGYVVDVKR